MVSAQLSESRAQWEKDANLLSERAQALKRALADMDAEATARYEELNEQWLRAKVLVYLYVYVFVCEMCARGCAGARGCVDACMCRVYVMNVMFMTVRAMCPCIFCFTYI